MAGLVGLIDLIELELDLSTGRQSLRSRLLDSIDQIRRSEDNLSPENMNVLLEVCEWLNKIERLLIENGFQTAVDTSGQ